MQKIDASPEQLAKAIFDAADRKAGIQRKREQGETAEGPLPEHRTSRW